MLARDHNQKYNSSNGKPYACLEYRPPLHIDVEMYNKIQEVVYLPAEVAPLLWFSDKKGGKLWRTAACIDSTVKVALPLKQAKKKASPILPLLCSEPWKPWWNFRWKASNITRWCKTIYTFLNFIKVVVWRIPPQLHISSICLLVPSSKLCIGSIMHIRGMSKYR